MVSDGGDDDSGDEEEEEELEAAAAEAAAEAEAAGAQAEAEAAAVHDAELGARGEAPIPREVFAMALSLTSSLTSNSDQHALDEQFRQVRTLYPCTHVPLHPCTPPPQSPEPEPRPPQPSPPLPPHL